jgi:hypothetical protein
MNEKINVKCKKVKRTTPNTYILKKLYQPIEFKGKHKVSKENFNILKIKDYEKMKTNNYNTNQLKAMIKYYKGNNSKNSKNKSKSRILQTSQAKAGLVFQLYNYLKFSHFCIKIQKIARGHFVRKLNKLKGDGLLKRSECVNQMDFLLLNDIKNINYNQFISYTDKDNFTYGFDICSLWNLLNEHQTKKMNPFNRNLIPENMRNILIEIKRLTNIVTGKEINIEINTKMENLSDAKKIEHRTLTLFQTIDYYGYITNINWFLSLRKTDLLYLLRELIDIWRYRAQLTESTKKNIFPTTGNPFYNVNWNYFRTLNEIGLKQKLLIIFENIINSGINEQFKQLGAIYVLGAITMVNKNAAEALPWLYESFYIQNGENVQ